MHSGTRNVKIVEEKPLYCCLPLGETVKCGWGGGGGGKGEGFETKKSGVLEAKPYVTREEKRGV